MIKSHYLVYKKKKKYTIIIDGNFATVFWPLLGIWLARVCRKSYFFSEQTYIPSFLRNMFWVTIQVPWPYAYACWILYNVKSLVYSYYGQNTFWLYWKEGDPCFYFALPVSIGKKHIIWLNKVFVMTKAVSSSGRSGIMLKT